MGLARGLVFVVLSLLSQESPVSPKLFKDLDDKDTGVRKQAYEALMRSGDSKVSTQLKATLAKLKADWTKQAVSDRERAFKDSTANLRKLFNAEAFAEMRKEALSHLERINLPQMETLVKKMWAEFYPPLTRIDSDPAYGAAAIRVKELTDWQKPLGVLKEDEAKMEPFKAACRSVDEGFLITLMPSRDQSLMKDNMKLREKVPSDEYRLVFQVNQHRALMGLPVLKLNPKLCDAAREHSTDMVQKQFFQHESPVAGRKTAQDRAKKHKASCSAENLFRGSTNPEECFWGWFRSSDYHRTMLWTHGEIGAGHHSGHWTGDFGP